MSGSSTYGGFRRVITQMEGRRAPMTFGPGEALPPEDLDFAPLKTRLVRPVEEPFRSSDSTFAYKLRELSAQFEGEPELLALHGLLIASLRRRDQPAQTAPLFLRMWREEPEFLLEHLDARWLISAVTTFADHGETEVQRRLGQALTVLFSTIKLYETERLHSGIEPWEAFTEIRKRPRRLALKMDAYAIHSGGLDVNMLGRLWQDASEDAVIWPLAQRLLLLLDGDDRNVFRRFKLMREARQTKTARESKKLFEIKRVSDRSRVASTAGQRIEHDPHKIRWGVVSTVKAPLARIARFAAYHLKEGAAQIDLYLDQPDPVVGQFFGDEPRVRVTQCDEAYWQAQDKPRPETHQLRQLRNATLAYRASELDFLAHIDVDEYLMPPQPMNWVLAHLPDKIAALQIRPAEMLAGSERHFKLTDRDAGHEKYALAAVYPTFGGHLKGGFLSHVTGKVIVRTGLEDVRLSVHHLTLNGANVQNRAVLLGGYVGHAHVRSWAEFREKLDFRLTEGSYRKKDDRFGLYDVVEFLRESEGETGLHQLYEEVCADTPELRERLGQYGMLLTRDLELDDCCRRVFGRLPEEQPA
ncbi:hypothetical protein PSM7751_02355 [Pseudooceanicola marinus]|uniref:Glycosyl transferase family 2 n=2 Tax=Pseudooceanicola marinus TaxID=396013 RepID=A0A1X6ZEQ5_9RHOB|nr:hypothetical protein CVM50_15810 [Pseudooceanicola marinus]SLN49044.1 hypothetical protein PSM7751_02355 [Pseudooceanicola marinus]